jgi:predicted DNA-binding transcriptional regulator YafY
MRADRLLSILMLLQARGRMTAQALARELEVSERTIYRDLEALGMAGVPVYTDRGRGGGCMLLDDYRTNLTGLTEDEVRALFMVNVPAPLNQLGIGRDLRSAWLKLAAALPSVRQPDEQLARRRIHLDSTWWSLPDEPTPCLQTLYEAVWSELRLRCTLRLTFGSFETEVERFIDPYGLVAKASVWHVVGPASGDSTAAGRIRIYRVSQILRAQSTKQAFCRPDDFDLAAFWQKWCADSESGRPRYPVTARVTPDIIPLLQRMMAPRWNLEPESSPPDSEGRVVITLPFESLEEARGRLLGLGRAVEVLEPEMLRRSIIDLARQTLWAYEGNR